jgi:DNA processing protein
MADDLPAQLALLPDSDIAPPSRSLGKRAPAAIPYDSPDDVAPAALALDDAERMFWVAWNRVRGVGPARFSRLLDCFGDAATAWAATESELRAAFDARLIPDIIRQRRAIDPAAEMDRLARLAVVALTVRDPGYPRLLREIALPPAILYVRGSLLPEDDLAVAIVGTRRISAYGRHVTEQISRELVEQGVTIVSGLARGIDRTAHVAALDAGGRTIAVLGCGPDLVYPPDHAQLAAQIAGHGAVVSEFAAGMPPEAGNFPARNRIISGLVLGVLIAEAPEASGALITAQFAAEQGREVMAIPGNITSRGSVGCNRLIQDGALCALSGADIMGALNLHLMPQQLAMRDLLPANETEATILRWLDDGEKHVDDLCRLSSLPAAAISSALVMMELKGLVRGLGGMVYARS